MQVRAYSRWAGMYPFQLRYVLKTLKIPFLVKKKFCVEDLDALLEAGGACIFVYDRGIGGHAVFIDRKVEGGFRAWNKKNGSPPFFARDELVQAILKSTRRKGGLYVYTFQAVTN